MSISFQLHDLIDLQEEVVLSLSDIHLYYILVAPHEIVPGVMLVFAR